MKSFFEILGIEPRYGVDARELEARYHELSRIYHPDRHARADGPTRVKNALATSELNQAYRALRDPVKRAEHLLALRGVKVAGEERGASASMPQEFLEQALEDREKLLEAKMEGGPEAVGRLAEGVRAKRQEAMDEIARALREPNASDEQLRHTAELLARLRYYARYLDEVEGRAVEI